MHYYILNEGPSTSVPMIYISNRGSSKLGAAPSTSMSHLIPLFISCALNSCSSGCYIHLLCGCYIHLLCGCYIHLLSTLYYSFLLFSYRYFGLIIGPVYSPDTTTQNTKGNIMNYYLGTKHSLTHHTIYLMIISCHAQYCDICIYIYII